MVMHIPCIKVLVTGAQYMQASLTLPTPLELLQKALQKTL